MKRIKEILLILLIVPVFCSAQLDTPRMSAYPILSGNPIGTWNWQLFGILQTGVNSNGTLQYVNRRFDVTSLLSRNYHIGTQPASTVTEDASHRFATDAEKITWSNKQAALVSGTNIKTINNQALTGSGNITITSSGGSAYDGDTTANQDTKWTAYIQKRQAPVNQSYSDKWFQVLDLKVYPFGGIYTPTASLGGTGATVSSSTASVSVTAGTDRSHTVTFVLTSTLNRAAGEDAFTVSFGGTNYPSTPGVSVTQISGPANVVSSFFVPATTGGYRFRAAGSTSLAAGTYVFYLRSEPQPLIQF